MGLSSKIHRNVPFCAFARLPCPDPLLPAHTGSVGYFQKEFLRMFAVPIFTPKTSSRSHFLSPFDRQLCRRRICALHSSNLQSARQSVNRGPKERPNPMARRRSHHMEWIGHWAIHFPALFVFVGCLSSTCASTKK